FNPGKRVPLLSSSVSRLLRRLFSNCNLEATPWLKQWWFFRNAARRLRGRGSDAAVPAAGLRLQSRVKFPLPGLRLPSRSSKATECKRAAAYSSDGGDVDGANP